MFFDADDGAGGGSTDNPAPPQDKGKKGEEEGNSKMISQEVFSREIAKIRDKARGDVDTIKKQFEELQQRLHLSQQEKDNLETAFEEIRVAGMTEKQKLEHELDKVKKQLKTGTEDLTAQTALWRQRFEDQQIDVQVNAAVAAHNGVGAEHFLALFKMWGTKVKEVEVDGQAIGQYETRVTFPDLDSEGKRVVLDLTVDEAVVRMSEMKSHRHLFKHNQIDGSGLSSGSFSDSKSGEVPDFGKMNARDYEAWRKQNVALVEG